MSGALACGPGIQVVAVEGVAARPRETGDVGPLTVGDPMAGLDPEELLQGGVLGSGNAECPLVGRFAEGAIDVAMQGRAIVLGVLAPRLSNARDTA